MILDTLSNTGYYAKLSPAFAKAMEFLAANKDGALPEGRYPICEDAYALVKHYNTKSVEACHYEAHRNYIDVQYVAAGSEQIGWAPKASLQENDYLEQKDQYLLSGDGRLIPLYAGEYMILFPSDAHMPCVQTDNPMPVVKIILKIRVGE